MAPEIRGRIREAEFEELLVRALPSILGMSNIQTGAVLDGSLRPDIVGTLPGGKHAIVAAKAVTPTTQRRLRETVHQLQQYAAAYRADHGIAEGPHLILAVPDTLSEEYVSRLYEAGIDLVLDGQILRRSPAIEQYLHLLAEPEDAQPTGVRQSARSLRARLGAVEPGRPDWPLYQALVGEILAYLFSPPLERPIGESSNQTRINRRDFVLPNYAVDGFWSFLRSHYQAHYIVVDAKNYVRGVKKSEVLQLANYLADHGSGLFGLIVCRHAEDRSAEITRREQWVIHRKLILILNDADLRQMIAIRTADGDPTDVIRQKIEDFRLGF